MPAMGLTPFAVFVSQPGSRRLSANLQDRHGPGDVDERDPDVAHRQIRQRASRARVKPSGQAPGRAVRRGSIAMASR
jgi:hypothetical protein